jgi:hypothetical protein
LKPGWANSSKDYLKKTHHKTKKKKKKPITKIGLVEWLKVKALLSSPSTAKKKRKRKRKQGWTGAPVVHTYNPSYLKGGDWEDGSSRSAWAKSS